MRVITFNIRNADDPNGHSVAERAPRLREVIEPFGAELIGFQECTPKWLELLEKAFGGEYEIFNIYRSKSDNESCPILWKKERFKPLKKGVFWLSDTPETESKGWDEIYDCYRVCEYALLMDRKNSKVLLFMNTHFGFGDKGQTASARLIAEYARKTADVPTLVTGDFNMRPDSAGYREMCRYFKDANAETVNDLGITYHGYNPENPKGQHIDYCFVNEKVRPVSAEILRGMPGGKFPSDHYGILFELEI